ncbi:MAG: DUF2961 domain-containing protein, partial [Clostridiales bacterium]|nr:DUF2961 domain-containing protein [Clostridiales bacterium]
GCPLADGRLGLYSMYRWHTVDPICFDQSLRITVQQIGYGSDAAIRPLLGDDFVRYQAAGAPADDDMCYYDRADDYCSTAYWYQTLPTRPFPPLPGREARLADLSLDQDAGAARNDG